MLLRLGEQYTRWRRFGYIRNELAYEGAASFNEGAYCASCLDPAVGYLFTRDGSYYHVCKRCHDDYVSIFGLFEKGSKFVDEPLFLLLKCRLCLANKRETYVRHTAHYSNCAWCHSLRSDRVRFCLCVADTIADVEIGTCCMEMLTGASNHITAMTTERAVYNTWVVMCLGVPRDIVLCVSMMIADVMLSDRALLDAMVSCQADVWGACARPF